jgi:hypothetical protein
VETLFSGGGCFPTVPAKPTGNKLLSAFSEAAFGL